LVQDGDEPAPRYLLVLLTAGLAATRLAAVLTTLLLLAGFLATLLPAALLTTLVALLILLATLVLTALVLRRHFCFLTCGLVVRLNM
jgi:hypothetical protein